MSLHNICSKIFETSDSGFPLYQSICKGNVQIEFVTRAHVLMIVCHEILTRSQITYM